MALNVFKEERKQEQAAKEHPYDNPQDHIRDCERVIREKAQIDHRVGRECAHPPHKRGEREPYCFQWT